MKNFLSIDYGTKSIGLAYNVFSLVEPLIVLDATDNPLEKIAKICAEKKIDQIVLGLSEAEMANKIQAFAVLLEQKTQLPVHLMDETLSSHEVGKRMKEAGFKLKKRQGAIDHYSAAIILEDFLEFSSQ